MQVKSDVNGFLEVNQKHKEQFTPQCKQHIVSEATSANCPDTTRINKKDAFLNDHFRHFVIDFKLNALHRWKAQLLSFQDQKEKSS